MIIEETNYLNLKLRLDTETKEATINSIIPPPKNRTCAWELRIPEKIKNAFGEFKITGFTLDNNPGAGPHSKTMSSNCGWGVVNGYNKIIFPKTITHIPCVVFSGFSDLEEVIFKGPMEIFGYSCFANCTKLKRVVFEAPCPNLKLASLMFSGCVELEEVILPEGLEIIPKNVFANCTNIKNLTLPSTVRILDLRTVITRDLLGCKELSKALDSITLLGPVPEIKHFGFGNNVNIPKKIYIKSLYYEMAIKKYKEFKEKLQIFDLKFNYLEDEDRCLVIPSLDTLGNNNYSGEIFIPKKIYLEDKEFDVEIANFAFSSCPNLDKVLIEKGINIPETAFFNTSCKIEIIE